MRHRVFIAINLPEEIKKQLSFYQSKWPELPARWTKKENLHITLIFLGYVRDEELLEIFKTVKEAASKNQPFLINLKRICYGPTDKKRPRPPKFLETVSDEQNKPKSPQKFGWPRMVWAEGEKSIELAKLQTELENVLGEKTTGFKSEGRAFAPHITLGRLKLWEFRRMEPEERPEISEEISLSFEVNSIEIMESQLRPKGPDYFVLESVELGKR